MAHSHNFAELIGSADSFMNIAWSRDVDDILGTHRTRSALSDGTVITGRYIEVDPPHRMLLRWDRQATDTATPTFIEITLTPTSDGTNMKVEFSDLSAEDAAFYPQLWARHLDRIAAGFAGGSLTRSTGQAF